MTISANKRLSIYKRDQYHCVNCGSRNRLTIDHILPVDKGGTDDVDNLQTMCHACNQEKGNHVKKWWHRALPFVGWRDLTKLRTEMISAMASKDGLLEGRIDKRIVDMKPKIIELINSTVKGNPLSVTGLKNAMEAYAKRGEERDKVLLSYIKLLAGRVKELEDEKDNASR